MEVVRADKQPFMAPIDFVEAKYYDKKIWSVQVH